MRLGLREANQQFSAAMRAVRAGEEVIITDHGHPFAVISPWRQEGALERMTRLGILSPALKSGPMLPARPIRLRHGSVAELLEEERSGW